MTQNASPPHLSTLSITDATAEIAAIAADLGDYSGGAEADVATGLIAAEADIAALQEDLGTISSSDVATRLGAAESAIGTNDSGGALFTRVASLETYRIVRASLAITQAAIAALGASHDGAIDFAAALPVGAIFLGAYLNVTAVVNNAGDSATVTADLGLKTTDVDMFVDGGSCGTVARVGSPRGVGVLGGAYVGGETPCVTMHADVNLNTITKGGLTAVVYYLAG